jgi:hypothetical protein
MRGFQRHNASGSGTAFSYLVPIRRFDHPRPVTATSLALLFGILSSLTQAAENVITLRLPEDTNAVLHNPGMGWVLYENYPIDQDPHGSSTMLTLPNENFPEADAVALMFAWRDIETTAGVYDFSRVNKAYDYWASRGKELQLRMSSEPLMVGPFGSVGAPAYVLDHLAADEKQTRRMDNVEYVVPDSRNAFYQKRLSAFLRAVNEHFVQHRAVTLIDLRGFGAWGEWHSGFRYPDLKTRRAALKGILDLWSKALPAHMLSLSYSYDPDGPKDLYAGPNNKLETSCTTNYSGFLRYSAFDYALSRKNITFRRDGCGGAVHSNERRLNEEAFLKFRRAPLFGEFLGGYASVKQGGSNWVAWMVQDALSLHPNYLNLIGWQSGDALQFIRERPDLIAKGSLGMGYRFVPVELEFPGTAQIGSSFQIKMTWTNRGVGRALRDFCLQFILVNSDGATIAESSAIRLPTSRWLHDKIYRVTHRINFPNAPAGNYTLALALRDPEFGRLIEMPLREKGPAGTYLIGRFDLRSKH